MYQIFSFILCVLFAIPYFKDGLYFYKTFKDDLNHKTIKFQLSEYITGFIVFLAYLLWSVLHLLPFVVNLFQK